MLKHLNKINTLGDLLVAASKAYGPQTAFVWRPGFRARRWTFTDLHQASQMVAHELQKKGVRRGDRVLMWIPNSPLWVALFLGCQLIGAIAVPLAPQNTLGFVQKIKKITQAKLLIEPKTLEKIFENWRTKPITYRPGKAKPSDIAEILFTSGTTGEPKGVELRHENILSDVKALVQIETLTIKSERSMSFLPLSHIFEQYGGLFIPLAIGMHVTQAAYMSGSHILLNLREDRPTKMTAVPEFLKLMMNRIEETARKEGKEKTLERLFKWAPLLPMPARRLLTRSLLKKFGGKLNTIIAGGAALDPVVGQKWEALGIYVIQGYGATETSPLVTINRYDDRKMDAVGTPLPGIVVKLADDGEILVKGPNVVRGYWKNPKETAKSFKKGWYFTDDIGHFDTDGHLHIHGRKKFLIVKPSGENVFPEDIEVLLNKEPGIKDSAVLGYTDQDRFEIHAVLLPERGKTLNVKGAEGVIQAVNRKLEPYQRMQGVSIWPEDDFPRTVTKKIRKAEVLEWLKKSSKKNSATPQKNGGILERILAEVTGTPISHIHPRSRLARDLKLDSLARVMFVTAVEEDLGVVLDESEINETTTVADVQEAIRKNQGAKENYPFKEWPLTAIARGLRCFLMKWLVGGLIRFSTRTEVKGIENLEKMNEPVLFFVNHIAKPDGGFALWALPKQYRYKTALAAASDYLFEHPHVKRFAKLSMLVFNAYPFNRVGQTKSSFTYTGQLIDRGYSIMFFPEGHISPTGVMKPLKEGAGFVTQAMQLPVVPMFLTGTADLNPYDTFKFSWWKRPRVTIHIGKPIPFDENASPKEVTQRIDRAMRNLNPNKTAR